MRTRTRIILLLGFTLLSVEASLATNGMKMISCDFRSAGMGGAHVALAGDSSGAACNPAALARLRTRSFTAGLSLLAPSLSMSNQLFGPNDLKGEDQLFPLFYAGIAHRSDGSPLALGLVVFVQGGLGAEFNNVRTFAGTIDRVTSEIPLIRVNPTVQYNISSRISVGITPMLSFARMKFSLFPETYFAGFDQIPGTADDFAGMAVENLKSVGFGVKVGTQIQAHERVSLGFAYTSPTSLDHDNGDLRLNFGPMGLVSYKAQARDFGWPQEIDLGIGAEAFSNTTVALDLKWLNWSASVDTVQVTASDPTPPVPLPDPVLAVKMKWEDQWVIAGGLEHRLSTKHALRGGYNYGKSPVPGQYLNPAFPGSVEHHLTAGYGYSAGKWNLDLAWEHSFKHTQYNRNPNPSENPFGPDLVSTMEPGNAFHLGVTYSY